MPSDTIDLSAALRRHWGYTEFRPLQEEAMNSLMARRDTIIVLPTGGGKSLCFQVPAVVNGPALVISPLIALMADQVRALEQCGVRAAFLNSSLDAESARAVMHQWYTGQLQLLYAAPERALLPGFLNMLREAPPTFFAVDEAHCISQWGHDFRPEYRRLKLLRQTFPGVPWCALTATANDKVRLDIAEQLGLENPEYFVGNFDRPNLHYRIEPRNRRLEQLAEILEAHAGKSGIIYCITRKETEAIAQAMNKRGFKAKAYHAGLNDQARRAAQNAFSLEKVDAIVATVAFGMGIDRSNVRFVIHAALPKSIEAYQQETGRAGRDGLPAECVMLYSPYDKTRWSEIFDNAEGQTKETRQLHLQKLEEMDRFATGDLCRHRYLVEYFDQTWTKGKCENCDVCVAPERGAGPQVVHPESTRIAQMILSCVVRLNQRRGAHYTCWVLRSDQTKDVQPHDQNLSTWGLLKDNTSAAVLQWINDCLEAKLLERSQGDYPVLQVTAEGWAVVRGQAEARLSSGRFQAEKPKRKSKAQRLQEHGQRSQVELGSSQMSTFEILRKLRSRLAEEHKLPPFMILHDTTLKNIARENPKTMAELGEVAGMGEAKIKRFGKEILEALSTSD